MVYVTGALHGIALSCVGNGNVHGVTHDGANVNLTRTSVGYSVNCLVSASVHVLDGMYLLLGCIVTAYLVSISCSVFW